MKNWMKDDLIEKLDIEGLLDLDLNAIDDAERVRIDLQDKVAILNNDLLYTRFVIAHHDDIATNEQALTSINYTATELLVSYKKNIEQNLSDELKNREDLYLSFFNVLPDNVKSLSLMCGTLELPQAHGKEIDHILDVFDENDNSGDDNK